MVQDESEPTVWAVAGCLFEVSLLERGGAVWQWADPPKEVTLLGQSVRGETRHFRFRAEMVADGASGVSLRFRGRTADGAVVLRSVVVNIAPEKDPAGPADG